MTELHSPSSILIEKPSLNIMTHSIEITNEHRHNINRLEELEKKVNVENSWRSCCLTVDKRAIIFFSQLSISGTVIIFCMYMLGNYHDSCETTNIYIALLTFILGIHLPQPKISK
tara:strand:- start:758 stop:1102 length:345 start_codon:yes stop_codon:yes gene_type:complete